MHIAREFLHKDIFIARAGYFNLQSVMDDFCSLLCEENDVSNIFIYMYWRYFLVDYFADSEKSHFTWVKIKVTFWLSSTLATQSICLSQPCIFCLHILNSMLPRQPIPEDSQNYMHKMLPLRMFLFLKCMPNSQRGKCWLWNGLTGSGSQIIKSLVIHLFNGHWDK